MMLWDIIRDWFVQYIFGGVTSQGNLYATSIGQLFNIQNADYRDILSSNGFLIYLPINVASDASDGLFNFISFGDWLSTTSTIIVLIALCFFFFLMVRWLFRLTAGLIQGRG